mmetsp:Transcript_25734/g.46483  ORF Transcript_25734/g.46483 Transcript_25734/m.46483 type:complete len:99 (-) Transcript_25734:157-453(-)
MQPAFTAFKERGFCGVTIAFWPILKLLIFWFGFGFTHPVSPQCEIVLGLKSTFREWHHYKQVNTTQMLASPVCSWSSQGYGTASGNSGYLHTGWGFLT